MMHATITVTATDLDGLTIAAEMASAALVHGGDAIGSPIEGEGYDAGQSIAYAATVRDGAPVPTPPAQLPPVAAADALDRVGRVVTASTTLVSIWDYEVVDAVAARLTFTEALALGEFLSAVTGSPAKMVETMAAWAKHDEEWAERASELVELVWAHESEWAVEVAEQGAPTAAEVEEAAANA